jgi:hypothetical protein
MINSRHYLNNAQVDEPENWQDLEITLDFTKDSLEPTINLDNLEFVLDTATEIISTLETNGYYQGIPYRIDVGDLMTPALSYVGYLDPTQAPTVKASNRIEIALRKQQGADWLVEVADSFSFRYLASSGYNGNGKINNSDYQKVNYIINYIPDGVTLIILSISAFILAKELVDSVKRIAKQTVDLIKQVVPNTGTGVGAGVVVVTSWSIGQVVGAIINLAIEIAYAVGIIFALVKLIEQIVEQLVPKKRFHLGMGIKDLVQKACDHLELTLDSDLLDSLDNSEKWVIIPSKSHKGGDPPTGTPRGEWTELGVPNSSDGIDTFGDLIRFIKNTFNADYKLKNGVFKLERRDYWQGIASYTIPNTFTNQDDLRNENGFNTDELVSNYVISWDTDQQDLNTLDNVNGKTYQAVTSITSIQNQELVLLKGLERVVIPMSMAVRKDKLTAIEEVLKVFLQAADFLAGQLDNPQSFGSQFSARVGSMHISSHFLSRPKMVVMQGSKLARDQRSIMAASKLWENYHYIESFVTINDVNNQQVIFKEQEIPFCTADFVSLLDNNFCNTVDGEKAQVTNLVWRVEDDYATITYRVYRIYDNNLEIKYLSV